MEAEELFDWIKEALIDKIDKSRIIEEIDMSLDEYASTKAEEEAKAFAVFVMQPYITDELKPEDFNDRWEQFNNQ